MQISASMLYHQIQKYFDVDSVVINNDNYAKTLIFYNTFFDMDRHIVITKEFNIVQCVERVNNSIIICLNHVDDIPDSGSNDLIILNDTMTENMAFNILTYILEIYNEWEIELTDIVYNHHDFQALVDSINRILEIPVALFDTEYRYIAFSEDSKTSKYMQYVDDNQSIPIEHVNSLNSQLSTGSKTKQRESFLLEGQEIAVYKNVFQNGDVVARLSSVVPDDPYTIMYSKTVFDSVGPYIESLYDTSKNYAYASREYTLMHQYMDAIFSSEVVERESFVLLLNKLGCIDSHIWQTFVLRPHNPKRILYSLSYTCFQMENLIPGCFCIAKDNAIICMIDIDFNMDNSKSDYLQSIHSFITDNMFVGGVSRRFNNPSAFENMYISKVHAEYALDNGPRLNKGELSFFDKYALDYLLTYGSTGLSANHICHPAILTLMDHDKEHGTDYTYTLYQYMKNNMNAVATAKSLFIHRSSFINRMERINALIDLDLNKPEERLYIEVSYNRFYKPPKEE